MKKLLENFKHRIEKEHNLVEAMCLSDSNGLLWKEQYIPRTVRNIYSHSKSFTSLMVGIAIDEGVLTLDTKLVDVFKDEIDIETYNRLYDITVKNLLMMSSGFDEAYLMSVERRKGIGYPDYLKFLFSRELKVKSGTKFCYSNGDTYLLSRMIQKLYNKHFTQLCYEKIFIPLEIGLPMWGADPMGNCIAASELCLSIEEMNKLGILFLNKGVYKGERIVSEEYVKLCSNPQIKTDECYWGDYSFQFWMTPEGDGYRADGAYGQITFIWPKYDLALSFQRPEDNRLEEVIKILREEVLEKITG
jgi:CubicO group peptidase (beta-lactamase class C family)